MRAAATAPADEDRAVAIGLLLDSPLPPEAIDRGLTIADALRCRYGLDSGDTVRDRMEATRRVKRDLLDRLDFTAEEIDRMAVSLGLSLEPDRCGNTCANVRNLAVLELQKAAIEAFAEHATARAACP